MCCFLVPMVQAIATTAYRKANASKDNSSSVLKSHVGSLETMLWGGTLMLIVDHIINGEVTWMYPFFTALSEAGGARIMLKEMLVVGVPMSIVITAVWAVWALLRTRRVAA